MARAILEGRKTQTRRVTRGQGNLGELPEKMQLGEEGDWCPYGKRGDRLWVRETWQHEDGCCDDHRCGQPTHIYYKATEVAPETFASWRPSIYMPRWASRIDLEITGVRVERVCEITDVDALKEGIATTYNKCQTPPVAWYTFAKHLHQYCSPRAAFQRLWDSINAKRGFGWESNPWTWVVEFAVKEPTNDK